MAQPSATIVQDTREQCPLDIRAYPVEVAGLPVGDYGVRGFSAWDNPAFIVERKSLDDLCGSMGRGRNRFMREIERMRQFRFRALLIEADRATVQAGDYRSKIAPTALLATLDALAVRCGLHVYWCNDPQGAARQLESLVRQFVRGVAKDFQRLAVS